MIKEEKLTNILEQWESVSPDALRAAFLDSDAPQFVELDARMSQEKGCPGPREQQMDDVHLPIYTRPNYDNPKDDLSALVEKIVKSGKKHVVLAYITSEPYLKKVTSSNIHKTEIARLLDQEGCDELHAALEAKGITIDHLPMVKLSKQKSGVGDAESRDIKPVRFWTPVPPPEEASYVVIDDTLEKGTTMRGFMSHLRHHGITDNQIAGIYVSHAFYYKHTSELCQNDNQKEFVRHLRKNHPEIAERADTVLQLVGIDRIEALTSHEMQNLGGAKDYVSPSLFDYYRNFDYSIKKVVEELDRYHAIPEPTLDYVAQHRQLLQGTLPSVTRE